MLQVHNFGPAIPRNVLPLVFSPFKRFGADGSEKQDSTNLGLGLYIAQRIVTAHGGTIDVCSSDDAGTPFTVRLPRQSVGA